MADPDAQNAAPPLSHTDYASCDIIELQKLVELRTGQEVAQSMSKDNLVKQLEEDDRKAGGSRFLNLAPEMRNRIYRELLTLEPVQQVYRVGDVVDPLDQSGKQCSYDEHTAVKRMVCHAFILRVNAQIYREAKSILYKENEGEVSIETRTVRGSVMHRQRRVVKDSAGTLYRADLIKGELQHTPRTWSTHLRELPNVFIAVKIDFEGIVHNQPHIQTVSLTASLNNMLYSFVSFLANANAMPLVKIKVSIKGLNNFKSPSSFDEALLRKMLWPLSYFSKIETFDISIDSPDHPQGLQPPRWTRHEACKGFLYKCADAVLKLRRAKALFDEEKEPEPHLNIDLDNDDPEDLLIGDGLIDAIEEEYQQRAIVATGKALDSMLCWRRGKRDAFKYLGVPMDSDDEEKWQDIEDAAAEISHWDGLVLVKKAKTWDD